MEFMAPTRFKCFSLSSGISVNYKNEFWGLLVKLVYHCLKKKLEVWATTIPFRIEKNFTIFNSSRLEYIHTYVHNSWWNIPMLNVCRETFAMRPVGKTTYWVIYWLILSNCPCLPQCKCRWKTYFSHIHTYVHTYVCIVTYFRFQLTYFLTNFFLSTRKSKQFLPTSSSPFIKTSRGCGTQQIII